MSTVLPTRRKRMQTLAFSKHIVYVDESGDHGMVTIDPHYPVFVLSFCIFHKQHYSEHVVPELEKFKFRHFGHDQIVLHEHDIRKEKGAFRFRDREHKNGFMAELSEIVSDSNFILVSCVIDKRHLKRHGTIETNPYHLALVFCLETLYEFMQEKGQHEALTHVVLERRGNKEDNDLELAFRRICDGDNKLGINMPFEALFASKQVMSTGLQLADLVARPIGINYLRPDADNRAFDVLKYKFYCSGGRQNVGVGYEGEGLKVFPPKSEKPR